MRRRIISLLLALGMVLSLFPAPVFAEEEQQAPAENQVQEEVAAADEGSALLRESEWDAEQVLSQGKIEGSLTYTPRYAAQDNGYYTDVEEAIALLREKMVARWQGIQIPLRVSKAEIPGETEMEALIAVIFALATTHTGVANEGDYLLWGLEDVGFSATYSETEDYYYLDIGYSFDFYTSESMEDAVLREINQFFPHLGFSEESNDYTKVLAIYDYVCSRVKYAKETTPGYSDEYYKFTAFGALCWSGAVGLGYATLLYRLLLMAGVDCRVIVGYDAETGAEHAWNIVNIDGAWYNLDSMLDAGYLDYWYFLKGSANFSDHVREAVYDSADFHTLYPMAVEDYVPAAPTVIRSGSCGADASYTLYSDGYLEITGSGPMDNWSSAQEVPWNSCYGYVRFVSVSDGITSVGSYAFAECSFLLWIDLPNGVAEIGDFAFLNTRLKSFVVPTGLRKIGENAFYSAGPKDACVIQDLVAWLAVDMENEYAHPAYWTNTWYLGEEELTELVIPEGVTTIKNFAFYDADIMSLHIPDSVTSIGDQAFAQTTQLEQVVGGDNVSYVGKGAFCFSNLKEISLNGIEMIDAGAFSGCNNLNKLTLGPGLTTVGEDAFSGFHRALDLYIYDLAAWCNIDFQYTPSYTMKRISSNPLWYTKNFYCNGELITDLVIPDSVTTIKNYAFAEYQSLVSVTVPETVTSVGTDVFFFCSNLRSVRFQGNAPMFQSDSFTTSFFTAYYPSDNNTWTEAVRQQYGGTITWQPVCSGPHTEAINEAVAPTCTQTGLTAGTHCSACGLVLVPQQTVPVIPHTPVAIPGKAATCTETGLTDGVKCSVCGEILTPQETLPATGHTYEAGRCTICGEKDPNFQPAGLLGDADGSGEVDYVDAMLVLQYHTGVIGNDALALSQCDVDGSGEVDYLDAMMILQYHTGVIPAL